MHLPAGRAEDMFGRAEVERLLDEPNVAPTERLRVSTEEDLTAGSDSEKLERLRNR
jgi:hypothetical protein